jgi:hypothetical protein
VDWWQVKDKWNVSASQNVDQRKNGKKSTISFLKPSPRKILIFFALLSVNIVEFAIAVSVKTEGLAFRVLQALNVLLNAGFFASVSGARLFAPLHVSVHIIVVVLAIFNFAYWYVLSCLIAWLLQRYAARGTLREDGASRERK